MENKGHHDDFIPWTIRDVWLGVVSLGLWLVISLAVWFSLLLSGLQVNVGLFIALAELALLGPVWLLTIRKYRASWETLGLRWFKWRMVALGCRADVSLLPIQCHL